MAGGVQDQEWEELKKKKKQIISMSLNLEKCADVFSITTMYFI